MVLEAAFRLHRFNGWFLGAPRRCQTAELSCVKLTCCQLNSASTENGPIADRQLLSSDRAKLPLGQIFSSRPRTTLLALESCPNIRCP